MTIATLARENEFPKFKEILINRNHAMDQLP
jgi:hypothetical protein